MGLPEPSMALARQATAHSPTRAEATPMVMMLPRDTESIAALEVTWVFVWDLMVVDIFCLLECNWLTIVQFSVTGDGGGQLSEYARWSIQEEGIGQTGQRPESAQKGGCPDYEHGELVYGLVVTTGFPGDLPGTSSFHPGLGGFFFGVPHGWFLWSAWFYH
jgi:hypothetical protein